MDAQIASETSGADSRTSAPPSPGANADLPALLNKAITRLEELSARMAEVERHIANQRPDAERFAHEIGPIVLATRNLREEIAQHKDEMKAGLDSHKKEVAATLKQVETQIGQHRKNIEKDIGQLNGAFNVSQQMVQQGAELLQQSMTVYAKSTKVIEDVSLKAAMHVETTAVKARTVIEREGAGLKTDLQEMRMTFYKIRDWLITKTVAFGLASALFGALAGVFVTTFYTASRIDGAMEVQRNSAKWQYLIGVQNKKTPQSGDEFNRQIEQQMEKEQGGQQDAAK